MRVDTLISLCGKTGILGMTIKPGEGAKQAFLTWKLFMLLCIVLGLNCIYFWLSGSTYLDLIQTGNPEIIVKAFLSGEVDLTIITLVITTGKGASKVGNHFDYVKGEFKSSCLVSIFIQTSCIILGKY